MKPDIELRQLRYFVVVAEELNFTRAAERLHMAQPPLSRQIQRLENSLGVMLLNRTNRQVVLTAAGQVFLAECYQLLNHVERMVQVTRRAAQGKSRLTIGFEGSAHHDVVLKTIQKFHDQFSDVELILQEMPSGKQVEALRRGHIEVGLIEPIAARDDLAVMPLLREPLWVVMNETHPLASQPHLTLAHLADEAWITGPSDAGCGLLMRILAACRHVGFSPKVQKETNDTQMLFALVASGSGVTLLPRSACTKGQPSVVYRPLQPPEPEVELAIAWQPTLQSPIIKGFLEIADVISRQSWD